MEEWRKAHGLPTDDAELVLHLLRSNPAGVPIYQIAQFLGLHATQWREAWVVIRQAASLLRATDPKLKIRSSSKRVFITGTDWMRLSKEVVRRFGPRGGTPTGKQIHPRTQLLERQKQTLTRLYAWTAAATRHFSLDQFRTVGGYSSPPSAHKAFHRLVAAGYLRVLHRPQEVGRHLVCAFTYPGASAVANKSFPRCLGQVSESSQHEIQ